MKRKKQDPSEPLPFKKGMTFDVNLMNGVAKQPTKIHIVGVMEDDENNVVVFRWFSDYKGWWIHEVRTERILSEDIRFWKKARADRKRRETLRLKKEANK